ncbi:MAG: YciI family protein [Terriglobales bacterium]
MRCKNSLQAATRARRHAPDRPDRFGAGRGGRTFAYLQDLNAQGVIILVGRTLNTDENTMGLTIFRAESEDAARQIMNRDPAVKKGVMTATLHPFRVVLQGK